MASTLAPGLVARVIDASARSPLSTIGLVAVLAVAGWWSMLRSPLDALPELSEVQVVVVTEWQGRSASLVEDHVTYPIASALRGAPRTKTVRGQSSFGLSFVYVIFEDGTDLYWARSRVVEGLAEVRARLPSTAQPALGPDATGLGWVFQYALVDESGQNDLAALRAVQDWTLRSALESVPGVAEVAPIGGAVKQLQVIVDPQRLAAHGVGLPNVVDAVAASNADGGGRVLEIAGHEHTVRSRGALVHAEELREAPIIVRGGTPLRVGDVAEVSWGPGMQGGLADLDGEGEVVGGIVVMRHGENALRVVSAVKERLSALQQALPPGVRVEVVYDRTELIQDSITTLRRTLIEEAVIVSLVILLFLLHARSALVVIVTIPAAVLLAFIPMAAQGVTANIMSLGGIAVAIGALVDASIIIVENVHRRLAEWEAAGRQGERVDVVVAAMQEIGPSIFFSLLVITVSFLPIFALESVEGRLFGPLAFTKSYAMLFGAVLAVTLTPALVVLLLRGSLRSEQEHPLSARLAALYAPVVRWTVDHPRHVLGGVLGLLVLTVPVFLALDKEFMPPLDEGSLLNMPSSPPGMSITEAGAVLQASDRALVAVPEVARVFGKVGRAETATDPAPLAMMETTILLKPRHEWRAGLTRDDLLRELDAAVQIPGMPNLWWMPIQTRVEMLSTGVRSPLALEIRGPSPESIEEVAVGLESALRQIPGSRSVLAERVAAAGFVDIVLSRTRAARHGVTARDLADSVESALGGMKVTEIIDGRRRFPVSVRVARELRDDPEEIGRVLIGTASGAQVPIAQVADVVHRTGPDMLRSADGELVGYVFVDSGERPLGAWLDEAEDVLARHLAVHPLPEGTRLFWTGQAEHLRRANERLLVVVPLTLLLVFLLLRANTGSFAQTWIVLLAVPFSLIGAVWLVFLLGYKLSVAVWVGFIALAGLDAETGAVMLLYLRLARERRARDGRLQTEDDLREAMVEGAAHRLRPKLMTVACLVIGLTPLLWSEGAGADVTQRVAAPLVGGLVTSFLLELLVYPAAYAWWARRELPQAAVVRPEVLERPASD